MGLSFETTYFHMELSRAIDKIDRHLSRARRGRKSSSRVNQEVEQILEVARHIDEGLKEFYFREREELFPRVQRIFGSEVEEVRDLVRYQGEILSALEQFIEECSVVIRGSMPGHVVRLTYLELLFGEFAQLYDLRSQIERGFHQTFSTLLYPGGLSTE